MENRRKGGKNKEKERNRKIKKERKEILRKKGNEK